MKRNTLNFIIDMAGFGVLLALTCTGVIMKYVLPPGTGGLGRSATGGHGRGDIKTLLAMTRHQWGSIHFVLAVVFVALIIVHLALHWKWIKNTLKSLFRPSPTKP